MIETPVLAETSDYRITEIEPQISAKNRIRSNKYVVASRMRLFSSIKIKLVFDQVDIIFNKLKQIDLDLWS